MDYTEVTQTAAIIVTFIAFATTQYFDRKSASSDSFVRMSGEYNKIAGYRLAHPEVLETAAKWRKGNLAKVGEDREITKYYSYGELCISFCTVCLHHRRNNSMSMADYENYYSGLMHSLATENRAFFEDVVSEKECAREFKKWFSQWKGKTDARSKRSNVGFNWSLSLRQLQASEGKANGNRNEAD